MAKTALITGGSSGLGFAMADYLGKKGFNIIILAKNQQKLSEAAQKLKQNGYQVDILQADVTKPEQLQSAANILKQKNITIDFLILNAGVVSVKLLKDYTNIQELRQDIEVDLLGVVQSAYFFEPFLTRGSKVLLISSALGIFGMAGYTTYSAAKAGVLNFGDAWRRELLNRGINLYVALPADIDTPQYHYEMQSQPQWMRQAQGPRKANPPDKIARKIIDKCKGKYRMIIIPTFDVKMLRFLSNILPQKLKNYILDKIFPMPKS